MDALHALLVARQLDDDVPARGTGAEDETLLPCQRRRVARLAPEYAPARAFAGAHRHDGCPSVSNANMVHLATARRQSATSASVSLYVSPVDSSAAVMTIGPQMTLLVAINLDEPIRRQVLERELLVAPEIHGPRVADA